MAAVLAGKGIETELLLQDCSRDAFYAAIATAEVAVCLPSPREGFYLPGLEAMGLGTPVVLPDCVGNRAYAADGVNCLMPPLAANALADAVSAFLTDTSLAARCSANGLNTAANHTQEAERAAFARALEEHLPA